MLNKKDLVTIGWLEITNKYFNTQLYKKSKRQAEWKQGNGYSYDRDLSTPLCYEYSSNNTIYIPCKDYDYKISTKNNGFIVASTKKTLYRDSEMITPLFMLFKLERP